MGRDHKRCGASQQVSSGTAKSSSSLWLDLVFGDARKWLALGIAGGRQEQAVGAGQPKSPDVLRNEAVCAQTDGGQLDRDAFAAFGHLSSLLC